MVDPEIPLVPERFFPDSSSRVRVRVGQTVRRTSYSWSPAVLDLLQHLESEGFAGAPRALGFDDQRREVVWRVWRVRRSERERELGIVSRHGKHVALHVIRSKRAAREFLDGLNRV